MDTQNWYQSLIKPQWAPAPSIFGIVWPILYAIIAVTFGAAGYLFWKGRISFLVLLPFVLNLIFNFAYTPIQFGLKNNYLAALEILLVLGTLIWAMIAIYPHVRWVTYLQIPYLLWVSFATVLQMTITYLNK